MSKRGRSPARANNLQNRMRSLSPANKKVNSETLASAVQLFDELDVDGNGELDPSEVQEGILRLKGSGARLSTAQVKQMMQAADLDGNGTVSLDEFVSLSEKLNKLVDANCQLTSAEQLWQPAVRGMNVATESIEMVDHALTGFHHSMRESTPAQIVHIIQSNGPNTSHVIRYASVGSRLMAKLFGGIIFGIGMAFTMLFATLFFGWNHFVEFAKVAERQSNGYYVTQHDFDNVLLPLAPVLVVVCILPIVVILSLASRGQSIEHWIFGLQLVDKVTFQPVGFWCTFFRSILLSICWVPGFMGIPIIINCIMVLTSDTGGSMLDSILGTSVVVK